MNKFKQLFTLLVVSLCAVQSVRADVIIDETNFPDANFRNLLLNKNYGVDGVITTEEIAAITYLFVAYEKIETLEGIEHFTALTKISCQENLLTSLDVSKNTALTSITCYNNQLTSLDVSKNTSLTYLDCHKNKLTSLDLSNNTALTDLNCRSNQLTSLDVSKNTALTSLSCDHNQLTSLDVSKNTALTNLNCGSNLLTSLDVSKNVALTYLRCDNNQVTSLDVSKNTVLTYLDCDINLLTSLDVSKNTALTGLYCSRNQLTSLDVSKNTELTDLSCFNNKLTSLDVSLNTSLTSLSCGSNPLTSLDVSKNTALRDFSCSNNKLTSLDITKNTILTSLFCGSNQLTSLDVSKNVALTILRCDDNQLTFLDVSKDIELQNLSCYNNNIKGAAMDALVASLPQSSNRIMYVVYSENEGNEMSKAQVEAAKAKGWTPMCHNGKTWVAYEPMDIVTVKPTDNLTELISAATDGQEFRLEAGTYAVNGCLDISKSISIVAADEENKPVVQAYFNLLSGASLTLCNVVLDGSGLNTYTQAFLLKAENSTYDKLLVEGCEIKYFSKGVIYGGNVSGLAKEITFNNCLIHDIECNGGELFDFRKTAFNTLTLSNSTIWNSCQNRDVFRLDDSSEKVTADAKLIVDHNTFYNVGNSGQYSRSFFYVRYPNNSITFTNNIVAKFQNLRGFSNSTATNIPTFANNAYYMTYNLLSQAEWNFVTLLFFDTAGYEITYDPFKDADNGDFTITNKTLCKMNTGDPRWITPVYDAEGFSFILNKDAKTATVTSNPDGYKGELTIPSTVTIEGTTYTVTAIDANTFAGCHELTSIAIPSTVSTIGQYAFSNCAALTSVTIPNGVTSIGDYAFKGCIALSSITIPNSVKSIGYGTFQNCSHLTDVTLPDGLIEIPEYMFEHCSGLVNITIPSSVTNIGERAFMDCSQLKSVSLPTSLQSIGNSAFRYCLELKSIILPQELKSIGEGAFAYCPFSQVSIPASVTAIGTYAFSNVQQSFSVDNANTSFSAYDGVLYNKEQTTLLQAPALITTHSLASTTKVIDRYAFSGCQNLTSVTLPEGLTTIDNYAFNYTPQLTTVKLPESLTYLGGHAFYMSGISGEVTIPAAVENIKSAFAFEACANLQAIHVAESNSVLSSDRGVVYNKQKTQLMYMPLGFEGDYSIVPGTESIGYFQYNEEWKDFDYTSIITGCPTLTSLHIPASVNNIVNRSIRQNASLSSITVDETSPYFQVSDGALYDKDMKTLYWVADTREGSFVVPDGVEFLTEEVFRYASGLKQVTIPASVAKMGNRVFNNFTLEGITWLREEPLVVEYVPVENDYKWRYASSLNNCFYFRRTNVDSREMEYATCPLYVPDVSVANYQANVRWSQVFSDIRPISAAGVDKAKAERNATTPESYYSLDGKHLSKPQRGLNIVRMSNGTTRKVVVK